MKTIREMYTQWMWKRQLRRASSLVTPFLAILDTSPQLRHRVLEVLLQDDVPAQRKTTRPVPFRVRRS